MPGKQLDHKNEMTCKTTLLNNTGYRRTYHKTDKVNSNYFEKNDSGNGNEDNVCTVGIAVPPSITDIEEWLLHALRKEGFNSWEEIMPFLALPVKKAMVIDCVDKAANENHRDFLVFINDAVILSKSNQVGYDPHSPMIFSHKRISRNITLVTVNLKSFYELD